MKYNYNKSSEFSDPPGPTAQSVISFLYVCMHLLLYVQTYRRTPPVKLMTTYDNWVWLVNTKYKAIYADIIF